MSLIRRQKLLKLKALQAKSEKKKATQKQAMKVGTSLFVASCALPFFKKTAYAETAQQRFISEIASHAQELAGNNDLYASVMIAQAALESAWGTSSLSTYPNYNLFGIKGAYNGQTVNVPTLEDAGNQNYYRIYDNFKRYPSYRESLLDYVSLLRGGSSFDSQYYTGAWKSHTNSYQDATRHLTGRYATDTAYYAKLNNIIQSYGLTRYDSQGGVVTTPAPTNNVTLSSGQYSVRAGDTLWAIANRHGMSVQQLKALNALSGDMIYIGQTLRIQAVNNQPVVTQPSVEKTNVTPTNTVSTATNATTYTVVAGDTLWRIAANHHMGVSQLVSLNHLTSSTIYVGQTLKLAQTTTVTNTTPVVEQKQVVVTQPSVIKPSVSTTNTTYTVVAGDTLYRISQRHGLSVQQLKNNNGLTSDLIYVGQQLNVSGTTTPASVQAAPTAPVQTETAKTHQVVAGDNLYRLSKRYGMSVAQLKALNNLQSDTIYVGQSLRV